MIQIFVWFIQIFTSTYLFLKEIYQELVVVILLTLHFVFFLFFTTKNIFFMQHLKIYQILKQKKTTKVEKNSI